MPKLHEKNKSVISITGFRFTARKRLKFFSVHVIKNIDIFKIMMGRQ